MVMFEETIGMQVIIVFYNVYCLLNSIREMTSLLRSKGEVNFVYPKLIRENVNNFLGRGKTLQPKTLDSFS